MQESNNVSFCVGRPWHSPPQQTDPREQTAGSWLQSDPASLARSRGTAAHTLSSWASTGRVVL